MGNDVTLETIRRAAEELGLSGQALCVHASLRSFGRVAGGAAAVVDALLAEGCTLLVPTFSWSYAVPPPADFRLPRNGWDYDRFAGPTGGIGRVYTPDAPEIDGEMGAIARAVLARPDHVRGNHPLNSFTAAGPLARQLVADQQTIAVYTPLKALARRDGWVVLMGVGLEKMTLLHLAEQQAGRRLFRRWANDASGQVGPVEVGGCSDGFSKLEPILLPHRRGGQVGQSTWQIYPARATLEVATRAMHDDPTLTYCGDPDCERCRDAMLGGPILDGPAT